MRDLIGYGDTPIAAAWPGEARVAVSFVVNFEEGAEYAIADGDARNEGIYEAVHQLDGVPDYCILSHLSTRSARSCPRRWTNTTSNAQSMPVAKP